jgi:hypothetical protein
MGRENLDAKTSRCLMNRGRQEFEAAPPAGFWRAGIDRRHNVTLGYESGERGHREFRGSHKHDSQLSRPDVGILWTASDETRHRWEIKLKLK